MSIRRQPFAQSNQGSAPQPILPPPQAITSPKSRDTGDRLLRLPEVARTIGVSRATIYRYVDSGRLPRPVKVSTRCIAWRASEIAAWMAALQAA
jgi:prophage regulatory protein